MASRPLLSVFRRLLRRVRNPASGEVSDAELLHRFVRQRDEAAFELLLWRHGPMVLGLCRRVLGNEQDAEDAFQATFFVLARKARSIRKQEALASWLYKVAYRIACRAAARPAVRTNHAETLATLCVAENQHEVVSRDLAAMLDREVAQLPESYRRPVVLCYLEGKTNEEAARLLGCPQGTLSARLARARDRLRTRLERRGWAFSSAALATGLADKALAGTVSVHLVRTTLQTAVSFGSGGAATGLSLGAVALAEGVLKAMFMHKVKVVAGVVLAAILAGTGVGWAVRQAFAADGTDNAPVVQAEQPLQSPKKKADGERQADTKTEIAALRAEIAQLRAELDSAQKAIKQLKDALGVRTPPREPEPLYRSKPVSFWLEQLNDGDPKYRAEAVTALGSLAKRKKDLIPVLLETLKDNEEYGSGASVGTEAALALRLIGREVVPVVVEVLKDKTSANARRNAAIALRDMGAEAKAALPSLITALKDDDPRVQAVVVQALRGFGSDAKAALPVLVEVMEPLVAAMKPHALKLRAQFPKGVLHPPPATRGFTNPTGQLSAAGTLDTMLRIDPQIREALLQADPKLVDIVPTDPREEIKRLGSSGYRDPMDIVVLWERALEVLKKRYPPQK